MPKFGPTLNYAPENATRMLEENRGIIKLPFGLQFSSKYQNYSQD